MYSQKYLAKVSHLQKYESAKGRQDYSMCIARPILSLGLIAKSHQPKMHIRLG
jgi:hypothetical protein